MIVGFEVYKESLRNLGEEGIKCICYNFMPVLDWARTDLAHENPNGANNLYMNWGEFAYFDIYILQREGAREDWAEFSKEHKWGRDLVAEADEIKKTSTPEQDHALVENIIIKTQGFVSGNFSEGDSAPVQKFRDLLKLYDGIDKKKLQERNAEYWLEAIMPICDEYDINMCVHPDDPPYPVSGFHHRSCRGYPVDARCCAKQAQWSDFLCRLILCRRAQRLCGNGEAVC